MHYSHKVSFGQGILSLVAGKAIVITANNHLSINTMNGQEEKVLGMMMMPIKNVLENTVNQSFKDHALFPN
jgi:hypothetical protein